MLLDANVMNLFLIISSIILVSSIVIFVTLRFIEIPSFYKKKSTKKRGITQKKWYSGFPIAGILVAGTVAYLPLNSQISIFPQIVSSILDSAKLFVLQTSYLETLTSVSDIMGTDVLFGEIVFGILFITAPICTVIFIISILSDVLTYLVLRLPLPMKKYIFSELNEKTLKLAKSMKGIDDSIDSENAGIKKTPNRGLYIFCNVSKQKKESNPYYSEAKNLNFITIQHSILDILPARKKDTYYFVISENSSENLDLTLKLMDEYPDKENVRIYVTSNEIEDEALLDRKVKKLTKSLVSNNSDNNDFKLYVRHINETKLMAYELLQNNPLYNAIRDDMNNEKNISMLVIGGGYVGLEVLRNALWCSHWCYKEENKFHATVVSRRIARSEGIFRRICPAIDKNNITFYHENIDAETENLVKFIKENNDKNKNKFNYIVISTDDDEVNTKAALDIQACYLRNNYSAVISVVVRDYQKYELLDNNLKKNTQASSNSVVLFPFGCTVNMYDDDIIIENKLETVGVFVNWVYHKIEKEMVTKKVTLTIPHIEKNIINKYDPAEARKWWIKASLRDRSLSCASGLCASYIPWLCGYKPREGNKLKFSEEDILKYAEIESKEWDTYQLTDGLYPWNEEGEYSWGNDEKDRQYRVYNSQKHNESMNIGIILAISKIITIKGDKGKESFDFDFSMIEPKKDSVEKK